jgi:UDP-hydrolysing UDP-N-acetyl-D-glucosamine 2-epimerase
MKNKKIKVCAVITNRANFARMKSFLLEAKKSKKIILQCILSGSALSRNHGILSKELKKNKLPISAKCYFLVSGYEPLLQAKSTSIAINEFSSAFSNLKPDVVLVVGDRYEVIGAAIASSFMNIPIAHIQGGEVSGNLDESVRHAITKLSTYHFTTSIKSKKRVIKMGENKKNVFFTGCPGMDLIKKKNCNVSYQKFSNISYTGKKLNLNEPYIVVINHPVSNLNKKENIKNIKLLLSALKKIKINKIMFWPNADAYSEMVSSAIRSFKEKDKFKNDFTFLINIDPELYIGLLHKADCLIGNSSSFIREGSQMGKPAVILGERQKGREVGKNVIFSNYNQDLIVKNIRRQIKKRKFKNEKIYGDGKAGRKIVKILENIDLKLKGQISY